MNQEEHVTTQLFADQSVRTAIRVTRPKPESRRRTGITGFVITFQSVLFLAHWFVYRTWTAFQTTDPATAVALKAALAVTSSTFITASLLAFRYYNAFVRVFYRIAATWLGFFNFFFLAAGLSWLVLLGVRLSGIQFGRPTIAGLLFSLAALAGLYGLVNARLVRVTEIAIKLPNVPRSWRGRTAALVSDLHLGHVNGIGFSRRIVGKIEQLRPDIVFIVGDLFDGTKVNAEEAMSPLKQLSARYGAYFVTGNHEEFSDPTKYIEAIKRAGIGVLDSQKIVVDGLQIVGVNHSDSAEPARFRSILAQADIDRYRASILLSHSPHVLSVVEESGVSLQLSGHTHAGQVFPFTWFTRNIFGEHTYGLSRFGELMVYTSSGAGTWGPPMRIGTCPEIVLIRFE
jgi:uncharacterized protein